MTYFEYQQHFEEEANKKSKEYSSMSEDELIGLINNKKWDTTYQIWYSLGNVGTPEKSLPILFKFVSNLDYNNKGHNWEMDYLIRYHACEALFQIAKINDAEFKGKVQYGRDANKNKIDQLAAVNELKIRIAQYL